MKKEYVMPQIKILSNGIKLMMERTSALENQKEVLVMKAELKHLTCIRKPKMKKMFLRVCGIKTFIKITY